MKVLVTGATGYIGSAVTQALLAAGHEVVATARNPERARMLEALGCRPLVAALENPGALGGAAQEADGVIHTALAWGAQAGELDYSAVETMLEALEGTGKPFVYTSGCWVMGNTGGRVAGESSPLNPPPVVAWRPAVERLVQDAREKKVRGVVIRPAMVYGRGGGVLAEFVRSARERGTVRYVGTGENHWTFVHVDDLADLYIRALEQAPGGEVFLAAEGPAHKVREVAEAASRAGGANGQAEPWPLEEARQVLGPLVDGLVLDQKLGSTKALRLLGWAPVGLPVMEELLRGSYTTLPEA
ncbi:MAG TPA: NAD-dependent epimerase/dehydratase family protein [Bryobacteraceae bacterium]|nr:NAD-dependent epimerase/dehydratase family protein [Bryobacteraceae bacterium]